MFVLRCVDVSLAFFVAVYCLLSFAVTQGWKPFASLVMRFTPRLAANLLFGLRIAPLVLASAVTGVFVLPSFLLLEPRRVVEPVGEVPLTLSVVCIALLVVGFNSAARARWRTAEAVAAWLKEATPVSSSFAIPVYQIRPAVPALLVAGVRGPRVFISDAAAARLTQQELKAALRHEIAHVHHWDNLKKLMFRFTVFPSMSQLEKAWGELGEMAADDAAVRNASDALDLASAIIKLSRLAHSAPGPELASVLVQGSAASLNARVSRLVAWRETAAATHPPVAWYAVPTAITLGLATSVIYGAVLIDMHKVTEWLVR
jgi:Zn-dependent protease with chaperone function